MSLPDSLRIRYDLRVRPLLNADLKRLRQLGSQHFLFDAEDDATHLRRGLDWMWTAHAAVGHEGLPNKFVLGTPFGLGVPYPETTGYTLNTFIGGYTEALAVGFPEERLQAMIIGCVRFLLGQQLEGGAFTGGHQRLNNYRQPSNFNTGQIVLGLSQVLETWRADPQRWAFLRPEAERLPQVLERAGAFLAGEITEKGHFDPRYCYKSKVRTYYTRAAYGLLRTGLVLERPDLVERSRRFFDWAVAQQQPDGWIDNWGFEEEWAVLHTIVYTLRGLVEAGHGLDDATYFKAVRKGIDWLYAQDRRDFRAPELIASHYRRDGRYINDLCLTGLSQLAIVLKKLPEDHRIPEDDRLFERILQATKRMQLRGFREPLMNGAMPASYPIDGRYQGNDLIEWGTKFFLDTVLIHRGVPAMAIKG